MLAAAGADVTVFDNSPRQLDRDREVAARDGLALRTVLGDMRDLGAFADASFDLIVNPVSNVFCPDLAPVWRECFRVLRPAGALLAGFMNPDVFIFDIVALDERRNSSSATRFPSAPLTCPTPNACATTATAPSSTATRWPPRSAASWPPVSA